MAGAPSSSSTIGGNQSCADSIRMATSAMAGRRRSGGVPVSMASAATVARNVRLAIPAVSRPAISGMTMSARAASGESASFVTATTRLRP